MERSNNVGERKDWRKEGAVIPVKMQGECCKLAEIIYSLCFILSIILVFFFLFHKKCHFTIPIQFILIFSSKLIVKYIDLINKFIYLKYYWLNM